MSFDHTPSAAGEIRWITAVQEQQLWELFVQAIQAAAG
jgi:hypothetical protein